MTRFDFTADTPRVLDALCDEVRAGVDRKRQEELGAQSHCLALCTNLVTAYNTSHLQRTLDT